MLPVHLERTEEHTGGIAALADLLGEPVGLEPLLADLPRRARPSVLPRILGRAVRSGIAFDSHDQRDPRWWPQGISTSADASADGTVAGRRVVAVTWYSKELAGSNHGSRVTFLDLDTLRYRHVLLVDATLDAHGRLRLEPLKVHAGGVAWAGAWLHVAATARGLVTARVDDIVPVRRPVRWSGGAETTTAFGHEHVLPVRFRYRAYAADSGTRLRYSFLSLDRSADPPALLAGEYGRGGQSTRLARYDLDPATYLLPADEEGRSRPAHLDERGVRQMQGAVVAAGRHHVTASRGPWTPGSVHTGRPGAWRERRWAVPMGPEDLSHAPATDSLWTVTEHPRRRWICEMRRDWFD